MKQPRAIRQIPSTVTEVDLATGRETHKPAAWDILPPAADKCQVCAVKHATAQPHNVQSLYYQVTFNSMVGRAPTWADAMAHCSASMREAWTAELKRLGHWSEPPDGEKPVAHHGIEA